MVEKKKRGQVQAQAQKQVQTAPAKRPTIRGAPDVHTQSGEIVQTDGDGGIVARTDAMPRVQAPAPSPQQTRPRAADTLQGTGPQGKLCPILDRSCIKDGCELWSLTAPTAMCAVKVVANIMYYANKGRVHP